MIQYSFVKAFWNLKMQKQDKISHITCLHVTTYEEDYGFAIDLRLYCRHWLGVQFAIVFQHLYDFLI